ncbi:hypothetical protein D3C72_1337040 [compost metagenome]
MESYKKLSISTQNGHTISINNGSISDRELGESIIRAIQYASHSGDGKVEITIIKGE